MPRPPAADARRKLDRLRALAGDPRQGAYAAELFPDETNHDVVVALLHALALHPRPELRPALLDRYRKFAENGPKRDPGGLARAAILRALRDIALPDDAPLLLDATRTYEYTFNERRGPALVRASALIALFNLEQEFARYRAIELLGELSATSESGEPALTAIRVLADGDAFDALILFALTADGATADLVGECLKQLARAPDAALTAVVTGALEDGRDMVQLGLADLLIDHPGTRFATEFGALLDTAELDVLRYAVTSAVASRRPDLVAPILEALERSILRERMAVFEEGLELARDPALMDARQGLLDRIAGTPALAARATPRISDHDIGEDEDEGLDDS
jgi:hypothetical protein